MDKIRIIYEPTDLKPFLVIYKPKNLPTAPLSEDDKNNALSQAIELYPQIKQVTGKKDIEYGLLHRLDTPTDGLIVIALNQETYDFLQNEQKEGRFIKYYTAKCSKLNEDISNFFHGFPKAPLNDSSHFCLNSMFRAYGPGNKEVRPVTKDSGKKALSKIGKEKNYTTEVNILSNSENECLVCCKIKEGFRHQVRCHLAWAGLPIIGDKLYNPDKKNAEEPLRFSATKIEFEYPKGDLNSYEITFTWT